MIGFGGYPALPALLGAKSAGIPTVIHEQNAVLGRVNRLLAGGVNAIATAYPDVERLKPASISKRLTSSAIRCATRYWRCATSRSPPSPRTACSACW